MMSSQLSAIANYRNIEGGTRFTRGMPSKIAKVQFTNDYFLYHQSAPTSYKPYSRIGPFGPRSGQKLEAESEWSFSSREVESAGYTRTTQPHRGQSQRSFIL
jgi:hypothetical protein